MQLIRKLRGQRSECLRRPRSGATKEPGRRLGPSPEGHRILQPRSETYGMPGPGVRGGTEEADHLLRVRVVSVGYAVVR